MNTDRHRSKITRNQITVIKIRQNELGLDDETYRDFLEGLTGKRSCTELSFSEARDVIMKLAQQHKPKKTANPPAPLRGRGCKKDSPPSDGKETINEKQQECIEAFRDYMKWDVKKMQVHSKKICKVWWPQTRAHGVKLIVNLIVINADAILRNIQFMDKSKLTKWEKEFLYFNEGNALDQFLTYVANKNKRGKRTMPGCSMLKLLEILMDRPIKTLGVVPVNDRERI